MPGSFAIVREVYFVGTLERGKVSSITGYKERQARSILSQLIKEKFLVSDTPKGNVRMNFPLEIVEQLFPRLYPQT
mgnify:FL=1